MKATTTPVSSSAGAQQPRQDVGGQHQTGQQQAERQLPAQVGAGEPARQVRHGQPDEGDRAAGRGGGGGQHRHAQQAGQPVAAGRQAQGARHAAAQRQQVQRPRQRQGQQQAGGDIGAARPAAAREWPASEPTAQKR